MNKNVELEKGKSYILKYRDKIYSHLTFIYLYRLLESNRTRTTAIRIIVMNVNEGRRLSVRSHDVLNEPLDGFIVKEIEEVKGDKNLEGNMMTQFSKIIECFVEGKVEVYRFIKNLYMRFSYISTSQPGLFIRITYMVDGFEIQPFSKNLLSIPLVLIGNMDKEGVEVKFTEILLEELKNLYT